MLLNNQWITGKIKEQIKKYLETNENVSTTFQNAWDTAKTVLKGKFIVILALETIHSQLNSWLLGNRKTYSPIQGYFIVLWS